MFIPCAQAFSGPRAVDDQKKVAKFPKPQVEFSNLTPNRKASKPEYPSNFSGLPAKPLVIY